MDDILKVKPMCDQHKLIEKGTNLEYFSPNIVVVCYAK